MKKLVNKINQLKKDKIAKVISDRFNEFQNYKKTNPELFKELCFCLTTANFNAEKCINIQSKMQNKFYSLPKENLRAKMKELGHRFPNTRTEYIFEARKHRKYLSNVCGGCQHSAREWLVKNVKGLGWKEASHFLRNVGFNDVAIIDFHIIDILVENNLIKKPKTISKKMYLEIEEVLRKLAKKVNLTLSELDLYLWYMETGKVLK